jgi:hypothetical protein
MKTGHNGISTLKSGIILTAAQRVGKLLMGESRFRSSAAMCWAMTNAIAKNLPKKPTGSVPQSVSFTGISTIPRLVRFVQSKLLCPAWR